MFFSNLLILENIGMTFVRKVGSRLSNYAASYVIKTESSFTNTWKERAVVVFIRSCTFLGKVGASTKLHGATFQKAET